MAIGERRIKCVECGERVTVLRGVRGQSRATVTPAGRNATGSRATLANGGDACPPAAGPLKGALRGEAVPLTQKHLRHVCAGSG